MKKAIEQVIAKLERIQVSGAGAILMGESLVELLAIEDSIPEPEPEEEKEDAND